jgi:hypothetical protein
MTTEISDLMRICLNGHSNNEHTRLLINLIHSKTEYKSIFDLNLTDILNDVASEATEYVVAMHNHNGSIARRSSDDVNYLKKQFHQVTPQLRFHIEVEVGSEAAEKRSHRSNDLRIISPPTNQRSAPQPNGQNKNGIKFAYQFVWSSKSNSSAKLPKLESFPNAPFKCPFCYLNCRRFDALVKHFTFVHFRFHVECIVSFFLLGFQAVLTRKHFEKSFPILLLVRSINGSHSVFTSVYILVSDQLRLITIVAISGHDRLQKP